MDETETVQDLIEQADKALKAWLAEPENELLEQKYHRLVERIISLSKRQL